MKLYVQLFIQDGRQTTAYINADKVENIGEAVKDYFINNCTWCTLFGYKIITRLDGPYNSLDKKVYERKDVLIEAKKEYYSDNINPITGQLELLKVTEAIVTHY